MKHFLFYLICRIVFAMFAIINIILKYSLNWTYVLIYLTPLYRKYTFRTEESTLASSECPSSLTLSISLSEFWEVSIVYSKTINTYTIAFLFEKNSNQSHFCIFAILLLQIIHRLLFLPHVKCLHLISVLRFVMIY